jgi:hypothetical protein
MPDVLSINGTTKRVTLTVTGDVSVADILSSHSRWIHDNQWAQPAFLAQGLELKNAALGIYSTLEATLINGYRMVATGNTNIVGGILNVDGGVDDPFIPAVGQTLIKYSQPIKTETLAVNSGGGGSSGGGGISVADVWADQMAVEMSVTLKEIWARISQNVVTTEPSASLTPSPPITDMDYWAMLEPFAIPITYAGGVFMAIFDHAHTPYGDGIMLSGTSPTLTCRTMDVLTLNQGDLLTVDGTPYRIRDIQPDGSGITKIEIKI